MEERLQKPELLLALSEVAVEVHHARTVDGTIRATGDGLRRHGMNVAIIQYRDDDLLLRHYNGEVPAALQEVLGPAPWKVGRRMRENRRLPLHQAEDAGRALFFPDLAGLLLEHYQGLFGVDAEVLLAGLQALGFGRAVIAPVSVLGEPWGGLLVGRENLSEQDVPAIGLFGLQFGSALEGATTIARLEARNQELELAHRLARLGPHQGVGDMVHLVLSALCSGTESDVAAIHRYDPDRDEYVIISRIHGYRGTLEEKFERFKLAEWLVGLQRAVSIRARDLPVSRELVLREGFEHLALVPLHVEARPMGLLTMARRTDAPYREQDLRLAERMGGQVAAAIERARLYEESVRQVQQLSLLYDVARAGQADLGVQALVDRVLRHMVTIFPARVANVHVLEGGVLRLLGLARADAQSAPPLADTTFPLTEASSVGAAVLARRTLSFSSADFPPLTRRTAELHGVDQLVSCPLETGGRIVGTLCVARRGGAFTRDEQTLLESVAAQLAVLMEQARLYSDLRRSYQELSRTQAELVRHERLAALGELSAVMAHEVRNPLGVIFNSLTSLRKLVPSSPDVDLLLDIVGEEADRLNRIVGDLLDFARPYALQAHPVHLKSLLHSAVDAALQAGGPDRARVLVEQEGDVPEVQADPRLLRQALVNLVVNAIQAVPKGGKVTVRAALEAEGLRRWAKVSVHDEGPGMSPAVAERVFQPFFTTKATGTGLGLAIVKRIIEEHGGDVSASSSPRGSTFVVRLPLTAG